MFQDPGGIVSTKNPLPSFPIDCSETLRNHHLLPSYSNHTWSSVTLVEPIF